ncbi:hypothetical protein fHeYen902_127 [Yersinia phage fHe-Yen9-02]|nr:hypothetical protein fHeYen902_127 [Yersinia phage fHe-Yen9-02]
MKQRYVEKAIRQFYAPHWLRLSDELGVDPRTCGHFNRQGDMIGLNITTSTELPVVLKLAHLELIRTVNEGEEGEIPVVRTTYKFGAHFYEFIYFANNIAIGEKTSE